ncbi:Rpn family recombination-promoting nuclease/putative transposase [uncultured Ilyobacter sp.]|uniref:Rpn family recombination-promoting nuclease/putative transposase n=1 Tax=uncultured Ilyobacter sp. TaxID=544433 RepID=UPI003747BC69
MSMNKVFELLPESLKNDCWVEASSKGSFIEEDMLSYFEDKLYIKDIDGSSEALYIFYNKDKKSNRVVVNEFLKVLMHFNKGRYSNIKSFIHSNGKLYSISEYLRETPVDLESYAPDFEYILNDISSLETPELKEEIKLKLFSEVSKFIFKDEELLKLFKSLLNN